MFLLCHQKELNPMTAISNKIGTTILYRHGYKMVTTQSNEPSVDN